MRVAGSHVDADANGKAGDYRGIVFFDRAIVHEKHVNKCYRIANVSRFATR
jgi:hypothetical protein